MKSLFKTIPLSIASFALAGSLHASIVINMRAERLQNNNAAGDDTAIVAGTLLQLIDLGADGVFNPISLVDGSASGLNRWVSGDDSVLNVAFNSGVGLAIVAGDFASTASFDMRHANQAESANGRLNRIFEFANGAVPVGAKIGLRWFPAFQASNFGSITLAGGEAYGQFTRNVGSLDGGATPINGGTLWIMPADGANVTFDTLGTAINGFTEANILGDAKYNVIIPEPATIGLSLIGAAGLAFMRRRRA